MADTQIQLQIASLGTRETIRKAKVDVVVTAGADTTTTTAVVFDKPFVEIPEIIGAVCTDAGVIKGSVSATDITKTGFNANIYQVLSGDVSSDTYSVEVSYVGWIAA